MRVCACVGVWLATDFISFVVGQRKNSFTASDAIGVATSKKSKKFSTKRCLYIICGMGECVCVCELPLWQIVKGRVKCYVHFIAKKRLFIYFRKSL